MAISVRLCDITKRFPGGVEANRNVFLDAQGGDVHAILGENGAGKTTLMRILAGLCRPDSGYIELDGHRRFFRNPREAMRAGVGMVHQHFSLIPALTVAENLALSDTDGSFVLSPSKWSRHLGDAAKRLGFSIRPDVPVSQLSLGERQRVEIFRLVLGGARILVLDEPTSILAPPEAEVLFNHIQRFAKSGHVVFLITHKIHHVRAVANRLTVMRGGEVVASGQTHDWNDDQLAELMVGKALAPDIYGHQEQEGPLNGRILMTLSHLSVKPTFSPYGIRDVDLELRSAEVLGIAGVSGSGQDELVAAITRGVKHDGSVHFDCQQSDNGARRGLGFVPADRLNEAVAASLSVQDNLALRKYCMQPFAAGVFLRGRAFEEFARRKMVEFDIRPLVPSLHARVMSGGNIQKVILARELAERPAILVAVNPTAGLDVATVQAVHAEILKQAAEGMGVLLVSEDLDELMLVCDRIAVVSGGRVHGVFETAKVDKKQIGLLMSNGRSRTGQSAVSPT